MIPGIVSGQAVNEDVVGVTVSWNPSAKHADIVLSDSNMTATNSATNQYRAVRATLVRDSGRRYFECRATAIGNSAEIAVLGLMTVDAVFDNYLGSGTGVAYSAGFFANGAIYANNVFVGSLSPLAASAGEWIGVLVDFDTGEVWIRDTDGWNGDPLDGVDPAFTFTALTPLFPATSLYGLNDEVEFNGGHIAFAYSDYMPEGITAWNGVTIPASFGPGSGVIDGLSEEATFAFSMSRQLSDSYGGAFYVDAGGGEISTINDQSGNGFNLSQATAGSRPDLGTAGPNSRACASFDGLSHQMPMTGVSLSSIFDATSFYVIMSVIVDAIDSNDATMSLNEALWRANDNNVGFYLKNAPTGHAMFDDSGVERTTTHSSFPLGTPVVVEMKRDGATLSSRINGGAWEVHGSVLSANNPTASTFLIFANATFPATEFLEGDFFECVGFNQVLSTAEEDILKTNLMSWIGA